MTITKFENSMIFDVAKDVHARVLLEKLGYTYIDGTWQLGVPKTLMQASPAYIPVHIKIEEPVEEEELGVGSFNDLVYVEPVEDIELNYSVLSETQLLFLLDNLEFDKTYGFEEEDATYLSYDKKGKVWFTEVCTNRGWVSLITFNDIFKHKSEV